MKKLKINKSIFIAVVAILFLYSCNRTNEYIFPKPIGYFRLDLPEKHYVYYDSVLPFSFHIPKYASLVIDSINSSETFLWFNVVYPSLHGKLHCSYAKLNNDLYNYTEDTHAFVFKHVPKADDISVEPFSSIEHNVYGLIYHINGIGAASPLQFYVTDSVNHFVRGALYFEHEPNNDSIAPIIGFVNEDILEMINTLQWKSKK